MPENLETQMARFEGTVTAELRSINRTLGDLRSTIDTNHADHEARLRLLEINSSSLAGKLTVLASIAALLVSIAVAVGVAVLPRF
jgi:hypothetical protein